MNKKQYQSPLMKVVSTKCECLLSGSVTGTEKVTISENNYDEENDYWE